MAAPRRGLGIARRQAEARHLRPAEWPYGVSGKVWRGGGRAMRARLRGGEPRLAWPGRVGKAGVRQPRRSYREFRGIRHRFVGADAADHRTDPARLTRTCAGDCAWTLDGWAHSAALSARSPETVCVCGSLRTHDRD